MNNSLERAIVQVVTAYMDGKTIEYREKGSNRGWRITTHPCWNFGAFCYREQPKAREMTVSEISKALGYDVKVVKE